ncbi:PLP-dependent aminotransferase family protein [Shinella daejeonensis]|uniref:MocR-like pyridoxine biosynthesis transcription factor PdxR n=1 Tax=Shinella daejeonensis TaxID=659017 RepID=UPI0020C7EFAB|nr:PLP-dependent aminotransferase family protein [Shinella daejeonensis]MCP8897448.1 PLP-dependent aminotransferase family protein [Shinella daejeonensis]
MRQRKHASFAPGEVLLDSIRLDRDASEPLFRQLYGQLQAMILDRRLPAGTPLPSTRNLASDLGISRNTTSTVYEQLEAEGYIETRQGARAEVRQLPDTNFDRGRPSVTAIADALSHRGRALAAVDHQGGNAARMILQPGQPDARAFPFALWRRLISRQLRLQPDSDFGYQSFGGDRSLREAVAGFLSAARGVSYHADQVLITSGAQGAFNLLAQWLTDPGDVVLMEDPGYTGARAAFLGAGAEIASMAVVDAQWDIDAIARHAPRVIYLTPACQFPLGTSMDIEQRLRLLARAEEVGAWVIEDDFDREFSNLTRRIPPLQSVDRSGKTILVGSFSKTLLPDLRLGYIVFPSPVSEELRRTNFLIGTMASTVVQRALAEFIQEGHFARHARRMTTVYNEKRKALVAAVEAHLGHWLGRIDHGGGLQCVWTFRVSMDDVEVARRAADAGLSLTALSSHYQASTPRSGLMIGFASTDPRRYSAAMAALDDILIDVRQRCLPSMKNGEHVRPATSK